MSKKAKDQSPRVSLFVDLIYQLGNNTLLIEQVDLYFNFYQTTSDKNRANFMTPSLDR